MRIASEISAQWRGVSEEAPLTEGLISNRDYSGLTLQDSSLRLWLPDQARQALAEVCARLDINMTVYLTEFFATYLYGVHEVMRMRETISGLYGPQERPGAGSLPAIDMDEPDEESVDYDDPVPEIGKNIFALKIFIPLKIKSGLQARANRAGVPLGRFARAMICAHLFGRDVGVNSLLQR
jgi:hypothetical protein